MQALFKRFVSIKVLVRKKEEKLYRIIPRDDNHILTSKIPSRSEYSEEKLKARNPISNYMMKEKYMRHFPDRFLRNYNF